ncbi:hypothetical protein R3P38DRAFT_3231144 [Favolaschia claudopus]|uniref:Uncharacterized protein n=1 Tax=Favolaschia claudopus TaxID=2862362 RepID=A0AAV9ZKU5_9AGAR
MSTRTGQEQRKPRRNPQEMKKNDHRRITCDECLAALDSARMRTEGFAIGAKSYACREARQFAYYQESRPHAPPTQHNSSNTSTHRSTAASISAATNSPFAVPQYNSSFTAAHLSTLPFAAASYALPTTTYAPGPPARSTRRAYESHLSVQANQPSSSSNTSTWRSRAMSSSVPRVAASMTPNFGRSELSHPQARRRSISMQRPEYPSPGRSIHRSLSTNHPPSMSNSMYVPPFGTYSLHVLAHDNPSVQSVRHGRRRSSSVVQSSLLHPVPSTHAPSSSAMHPARRRSSSVSAQSSVPRPMSSATVPQAASSLGAMLTRRGRSSSLSRELPDTRPNLTTPHVIATPRRHNHTEYDFSSVTPLPFSPFVAPAPSPSSSPRYHPRALPAPMRVQQSYEFPSGTKPGVC